MPDVSRTAAELDALFADNVTGNISPQDLRDFVESVFQYGCITLLISSGPGVAQTIGTTFVKIDQFSTNGPSSSGITPDHTTDQLAIVKRGDFVAIVSLSVGGDPNVTWQGTLFNNNIDADRAGLDVRIGGGSDIVRATSLDIISLADGDVVDYRMKAGAAGKSFQLQSGSLLLFRVG